MSDAFNYHGPRTRFQVKMRLRTRGIESDHISLHLAPKLKIQIFQLVIDYCIWVIDYPLKNWPKLANFQHGVKRDIFWDHVPITCARVWHSIGRYFDHFHSLSFHFTPFPLHFHTMPSMLLFSSPIPLTPLLS